MHVPPGCVQNLVLRLGRVCTCSLSTRSKNDLIMLEITVIKVRLRIGFALAVSPYNSDAHLSIRFLGLEVQTINLVVITIILTTGFPLAVSPHDGAAHRSIPLAAIGGPNKNRRDGPLGTVRHCRWARCSSTFT